MARMNIQNQSQKGVVLFVALIVLVALSMAGIALSRSVDASLGIVGNLGFRQSTVYGADKAIADAIAWIEANRNNAVLTDDSAADGYRATIPNAEIDWKQPTAWTASKTAGTDSLGNRLEYIIERVCNGTGVYTNVQCSQYEAPTGGSAGNSISAGAFQFQSPPFLTFRITARAKGPKNSTSIVQTYYLVPM